MEEPTNEYKNSFLQKLYDDEQHLNKIFYGKEKEHYHFWENKEFCEYWGIKVGPVVPIYHENPFKKGK